MPGRAFERFRHVDQAAGRLAALHHLLQRTGKTQGFLDGHVQGGGDLLGHGIRLGVAHVEHAPDIADGRAGGHGPEGDDLGHMVRAVKPVDIVDDLAAAVDAEVHVDIRHRDTLGIQKAFKEQGVFDGVHIGDIQAVGHHAACGAAAPWADGDAVSPRKGDKVRDDQKIVDKPHLFDHAQLVIQLLMHLGAGRITL